jgi:Kdo2-lipid IVA lauroyltransferase/acyltransferase
MSSQPIRKKIKNTLIYWVVVFFVILFRTLPRKLCIFFMRGLARFAFRVVKSEREKTIKHLTNAFGHEKSPKEIFSLAKNVFLHFATITVDAIRIPVIIKQGINNLVTSSNMELAERYRDASKGPIVLTGHFGNWELMGAWLAQNGYPLRVIGTSAYDKRLDKLITETRDSAGYINIARGKGTREIINSLRKGLPLGILIDQDTKVEGVFVNFFGRKAHTAIGPVVLAQKFKIPIVPFFLHLKKDYTYHVECLDEIILVDTGNAAQDLITNTQKCSNAYEHIITKYPEQWVWMHERWKKQPIENEKVEA